MDSSAPLTISKLSKYYGKSLGVKDVSLELKQGEVFGFLGPNGAGKTTTIRTIFNFIAPTHGSIRVFGLDSVTDSLEIKKKVGYLAGDISLYENMTGEALLKYLTSLGRKTDWDYVKDLTSRFEANLTKKIKTLSKGNKQKIGLIQACMYHPDLLILDEPTSGLDPLMQNVFYELMLEMKKEGKSVFLSSHNLTEVQKICDRAAFIRNGELITVEDVGKINDTSVQTFQVAFARPPTPADFSKIKGVEVELKANNGIFRVSGKLQPFLKELSTHEVVLLERIDTTLEEVFMKYYHGEKQDD